jgi:hypothetical protein
MIDLNHRFLIGVYFHVILTLYGISEKYVRTEMLPDTGRVGCLQMRLKAEAKSVAQPREQRRARERSERVSRCWNGGVT